jgi:hypothetical protein
VEQGLAGKFTGLLLESLDKAEVVGLIDEPTSLQGMIHEALAVLEAHNRRETAHEKIVELFASVGKQVHGHPLQPPNIIFLNVRADTVGYPTAADQKGVMLL